MHSQGMDEVKPVQVQLAPAQSTLASLPGPIALLKESWQMYKKRWKSYWGTVLFTYLLLAASFVVMGLAIGIIAILNFTVLKENYVVLALVGALLLIPAFLFMIYMSTWGQLAMLHIISFSDQNMRAWESFQKSKSKIWSYMWLGFISSFIIGGAYLLFLIPGIIYSIWFSMATYIFVVEGARGMPAMLKSREYARNYWWPLFGRYLVFGLISLAISLLFMFIPSLFNNLSEGSAGVVNIITSVLQIVISPVFAFYPYLLYRDLKTIKGDVQVNESAKSKYMLVGIAGTLAFIVTIGLIIWFAFRTLFNNPQLMNALMQGYLQRNQQGQNFDTFEQFNKQYSNDTLEQYNFPTGTDTQDFLIPTSTTEEL